jgi:hypothetical protein
MEPNVTWTTNELELMTQTNVKALKNDSFG